MRREQQNTGFGCLACGQAVAPVTNGSYRNHCPSCLASRHLDVTPGDRAHPCGGLMDAVRVERSKKGWMLVHRCRRCNAESRNRVAADTVQPDDLDRIIQVMQQQ